MSDDIKYPGLHVSYCFRKKDGNSGFGNSFLSATIYPKTHEDIFSAIEKIEELTGFESISIVAFQELKGS
ncbi:hypothetical protein [Sneathiella sp.]|uniref:hypothetical protein n=1 Tax=Sneathiella sp. TaxID=1964365 RepID=UPI003564516A